MMSPLNQQFGLIVTLFLMGVIPLIVIMTTSFTKISIVLVLLRNALGVQQAPSNMALSGLALALTMLVMAPVANKIAERLDIQALLSGAAPPSALQIVEAVQEPLEEFMLKHVDPLEVEKLAEYRRERDGDQAVEYDAERPSFDVLTPAFIISEIGTAFKIGMLLALAFAVIDIIVANLLMAMGMTMFPPSTVAIPLKLLIFVLASGLSKLSEGLLLSYHP